MSACPLVQNEAHRGSLLIRWGCALRSAGAVNTAVLLALGCMELCTALCPGGMFHFRVERGSPLPPAAFCSAELCSGRSGMVYVEFEALCSSDCLVFNFAQVCLKIDLSGPDRALW